MRLDSSMLNYSFTVPCLTLASNLFSLKPLGLDKPWKTLKGPVCCVAHPYSTSHHSVQVWGEEIGEKGDSFVLNEEK